ncbi:hypothetical protein BH23BAC3_BH23BAC3_32650 [soil metagenome]
MIKSIKQRLSVSVKRVLHHAGLRKNFVPPVGKVKMADMERTVPFSKKFGSNRGGALDRYYIRNFLERESENIRGSVLEIGDNSYTLHYGGEHVVKSDILHVDESNPAATFIGDLSDAPQVPGNTFDCIVLTQTLHLIYEFKDALRTCHRILKPGGVLLLTVPGITPIDYQEWGSTWYWSFTDMAMKKLMAETFPGGTTEVHNFGNVMAASAFLYGMGEKELTKEQLDVHDPNMQIIITVKSIKKSN